MGAYGNTTQKQKWRPTMQEKKRPKTEEKKRKTQKSPQNRRPWEHMEIPPAPTMNRPHKIHNSALVKIRSTKLSHPVNCPRHASAKERPALGLGTNGQNGKKCQAALSAQTRLLVATLSRGKQRNACARQRRRLPPLTPLAPLTPLTPLVVSILPQRQ